jgi:hypothetical protein
MAILVTALKSPGERYRDDLRQAIEKSGKTQSKVALEAEIEPGNLANILAGRRKPLRDHKRNLALAYACGQSEDLAGELQGEAEAFHAIDVQPKAFRRYMAVIVRVLDSLLEKMEGEIQDMQTTIGDSEGSEEPGEGVTIYLPQSLLAAGKIVESLRYWWPVEPGEDWTDYPAIGGAIRRRLSKLSPQKRVRALVQMEVDEALQWVEDQGDLDSFVERHELIRRLAESLNIEENLLSGIISSLNKLANEGKRPRKGPYVMPFDSRRGKNDLDR